MAMRFAYTPVPAWPPLAWLASCVGGSDTVTVLHGSQVETTPEWFCEAVWDGPYDAGDFDRTDLVFGSGGRARNGAVTWVSAASTVDRLHWLERTGEVWLSNSLACLLAATGGVPDPTYTAYFEDFKSIRWGLAHYKPTLATSHGPVHLTYHDNLMWDGRTLQPVPKPTPLRDFSSFASYRDFLVGVLTGMAANLAHAARRLPYRMLGTISSGYDSGAVSALARRAGLDEAVTFAARDGSAPDTGTAVATALGIRLDIVQADAWRAIPLAEIPFLAADGKGEDVYVAGARPWLAGRVLLTGFHGDAVWGLDPPGLGPDLVRKDQSGLDLCEFRLHAGFIHAPVAFLGARQVRDIHALSVSRELAPWNRGRAYDRPFCRRVVEEAGVASHEFGKRKYSSSVLLFARDSFLTPPALADLRQWLGAQADLWQSRGRTPPLLDPAPPAPWLPWTRAAARMLLPIARAVAHVAPALRDVGERALRLSQLEPLFRYAFPWALARVIERYGSVGARRNLAAGGVGDRLRATPLPVAHKKTEPPTRGASGPASP